MEFEKLVTLALENLKENSVYQLLQSDMDFQQESNAEGCVIIITLGSHRSHT